ncbi:hypothetical protein PybrP1_012632, partial [[Pythium] brassicae (nom. inval.)]
ALAPRTSAGVTRLQWQCVRDGSVTHSLWVDAGDVVVVTREGDAEQGGNATLWRADDARGRFLVANRRVAPGERVLRAAAFAVCVAQALVRRRCHWCFVALARSAKRCGACAFALYCSRECLDADAPLHDFQCRALAQLHALASSAGSPLPDWRRAGVDEETVRLALAALSMEAFVGTAVPLAGLVVNRRGGGDANRAFDARVLAQVAGFVAAHLPRAAEQPPPLVAHVVATLTRVRSNAHPLTLNGATSVGVGVFPEAAMALNHACLPNVAPSFDRRARVLSFRATRVIAAGEALEYAYVELFQAARRRRAALLDGFGFACDCWRCVHEDEGDNNTGADERSEAAAMDELLRLRVAADSPRHSSSAHEAADELFRRRRDTFARSSELLFAYRTLQLQLATARRDWTRVAREAAALERMWRDRGLPAVHPTVEVLQLQVQRAAEHAGWRARALQARARVREIRRLCGYEDDGDGDNTTDTTNVK